MGKAKAKARRSRTARPVAAPARRRRHQKPQHLEFTISSDFAAGHEVQKRILDQVEQAGFNGHDQFAIKLALEEALINAIKHGNRCDCDKIVEIDAKVSPTAVEIVIKDQGPGFERCCVADPTLDENLNKCCGRGILLMEHYMNDVEWSKGGRQVRMVKKRQG